jgi:REP element-mobilizing transposase RayT
MRTKALNLLAEASGWHGLEIWSCCLIPNHVHIIAVPRDVDRLSQTFRHVHRHYGRKDRPAIASSETRTQA